MKYSIEEYVKWTEPFESLTLYFYKDVKNLVTIGLGCLCELGPHPMLRFEGGSGYMAWVIVKRDTTLDPKQGGAQYAKLTSVRATRDSVLALVAQRVGVFEDHLEKYFPAWESWHKDAQLGAMSMAWAMGPDFPHKYPKFTAACLAQDWATAANECHMDETNENDSFKRRNAATKLLFQSAAADATS